jgi:hypothetical protein
MRSNPNVLPSRAASLPRNGFDMSYLTCFTAPVGLLLPSYVQDINPGDFIKIDVSNFTRTLALNTAAYARIRERTDFYFVPNRLVWRHFDQFYTNVRDLDTAYSAVTYTTTPSKLPYIPGSAIYSWLADAGNDIFGFPKNAYFERLLDLLGYPVANGDPAITKGFYGPTASAAYNASKFNPFRLFAFARLFNEFYRQTDYEVFDPRSYNLDNLGSDGDASSNLQHLYASLCNSPYKLWSKDRFTNIKPSQNYTEFTSVNTYEPGSGVISTPNGGNSFANFVGYAAGASAGSPTAQFTAIQSAQGLRNALAVDRLARISQLAPKTYEAQMKAHFGVDVDACDYCRPRYLGSFDTKFIIDEVVASAAGSTGTGSTSHVGEIYGRGTCVGKGGRTIKAQFNEPGVVIGVHYFEPQAEYDSMRVDEFVTKLTRQDYYVPEYDSLGFAPLTRQNFLATPADQTLNNSVIGYIPRYAEYKSRYDEIHSTFQSGGILKTWTIPRSIQSVAAQPILGLKVSPLVGRNLFSAVYDGTKLTDSFLCRYRYDVMMTRNMSEYGLPSI